MNKILLQDNRITRFDNNLNLSKQISDNHMAHLRHSEYLSDIPD